MLPQVKNFENILKDYTKEFEQIKEIVVSYDKTISLKADKT